ncbi:PLP-dependent aminotransferase family protein [Bacillus solimangrovi]|uniref:Aminotransferase n=1 Tax=Bacillus solimangrovi TaxID=1305675 RepID=A0A1E5LIU1_9BACI|nr:PLP-dependent aminotransferase family protein [Bacillus solimangrovi]OEH94000.1 aminotransferase [Bacillus solimangrovi]
MKYPFAKRVRHLQSSAVRDLLKVVNQNNVISFAGGLPDEKLFPFEAVKESFSRTMESGNKALQYAETEGYGPLRELLVERMKTKGMGQWGTDNILITTGSQQAIDLFSRVFFNPGDIIFTENPTYLAALQVFESYEARIIAVEADEHGMLPEDLNAKMKQYRPKCIYVVPTFSNPAGRVWSQERRELLLRLAKKYHAVIFEDDPYGDIQFHRNETYKPIASMDDGSHVVYTSTFSKTVVPALRTGWIAGPHQVVRIMAQAKQANDLHSNSLSQQMLYHLLRNFDLDTHIQSVVSVYYERLKIMMTQLEKSSLPGLNYIEPKGGMFLWLELEEGINTTEYLEEAVKRGVAYVPGAPFYAGKVKHNTMRLNFTNSTPENIDKGMYLLSTVFDTRQIDKQLPI